MLSHIDKIKDTDHHFEIDAITRSIKNVSGSKTTVIQHDHNSERFTFEIPRYIEGHDMMECNLVEVHYENGSEKGIYIIDDLAVVEGEENKLKCTWLVSQNATFNVGALRFLLRFTCVQEDGTVDYAWNTAPYAGITVSTGIYNTEHIEKQHPDVIAELIARIDRIVIGGGGGSVDLSNYLTKAETTSMVNAVAEELSELGAYTYGEMIWKEDVNKKILSSEESEAVANGDNTPMFSPYFGAEAMKEYLQNNYYNKSRIDTKIGDIKTALDELHTYSQTLIGGGDAS